MKARRKSIILFLMVFLSFTLFLSACRESPKPKAEGATESYVMPCKIVHGIPSYIRVTLGDLVEKYPTIAYGTIVEKSEFAEAVKPLKDENAQTFEMGQKVTMHVEKDIQGCKDGDTITYWEIGGLSQDGTIYKQVGSAKTPVGETVLVFLDPDRICFYVQFQADSDGMIAVSGDFMTEEPCHGNGTEDPEASAELPMEEYLEKIEKVVKEQVK